MRIAVLREAGPPDTEPDRRVALTPDSVKRLVARKIGVTVQAGAGEGAGARDEDYRAAGAEVEKEGPGLDAADVFLQIGVPRPQQIGRLREGAALISLLYPLHNLELVQKLADRKVAAIAVDSIPRTTVAQMMDVLSSQATCAGYYAVLLAATALPRFFPMLMTAAGTIAPAKVLVLGAGVAGLQAIGTARRLGAVVEAFDVRRVVKEQVESMGAKFVDVDPGEDASGEGGYAREASEEYKRKQSEAIRRHIAQADVCITTALIPGQRAPTLITEEMVRGMRPGSVIVDLAAEQGGNCALTEPGKTVVREGVTLIGERNLPSRMAVHASQMYSRNMEKLILHLSRDGELRLDLEDEITRGCLVTRGGEIVHARVAEALARKGGTQ